MDELIKHRNIINYVKAQRLSWFRHINRMPETRIVKKIHNWKTFTRRPGRKAQVLMGRWRQERLEKDENYKTSRQVLSMKVL